LNSEGPIIPLLNQLKIKLGIVAIGILLMSIGVLVPSFWLKFIFFISGGSAISYVILTRRNIAIPDQIMTTQEHESTRRIETDDSEFVKIISAAKSGTDVPSAGKSAEASDFTPRAVREIRPQAERSFSVENFFSSSDVVSEARKDPQQELSLLLSRMLEVIKETFFAHTAIIHWVNIESGHMVVEAHITESRNFTPSRKRPLGNDLISKVAVTKQPTILNEINASSQNELLGYYFAVEPIGSFVAVPIYFQKKAEVEPEVIGVLSLDALSGDMYGDETIATLGHFTKLISTLLKTYADKFELVSDSEILQSLERLQHAAEHSSEERTVVRSLAEEASKLIQWDSIAVILYDEPKRAWVIQTVLNRTGRGSFEVGQQVDRIDSFVGRVLGSGKPEIIELSQHTELPRFQRGEPSGMRGSLMILPIVSKSNIYGAIAVENEKPQMYTMQDVKKLKTLVEPASDALEIFGLKTYVNSYIDEVTGVASRHYFTKRYREEFYRAADFSGNFSVGIIHLDTPEVILDKYGKKIYDYTLWVLAEVVRQTLRPYEIVARFDQNRFGVLLINRSSDEAQIWAEAYRKFIAQNIISVDGKSFSVTVTVGIAALSSQTNEEELLDRAHRAVEKAMNGGGNIVRVS